MYLAIVLASPAWLHADIRDEVADEAAGAYSEMRQWLEICKEYYTVEVAIKRIDQWQVETFGAVMDFTEKQMALIHKARSDLLSMGHFDRVIVCGTEISSAHREYERARRLVAALGDQQDYVAPNLKDLFDK